MRRDVQEIFRNTPHEKQVMMFSATLSKEIRPVCKKFMQDVITTTNLYYHHHVLLVSVKLLCHYYLYLILNFCFYVHNHKHNLSLGFSVMGKS